MPADTDETLTHGMFERHVGSGFAVRVGDLDDMLTLTEATLLRHAAPGTTRPGFSLIFTGARTDIVFDQRTLDLVHPQLGTVAMMITPIGRTPDGGGRYQAVFN